jgi:succinoglycan biosynthesis protein ExoW
MPLVSMVSVIIPFFQRESGILTRALKSILRQYVRDGWTVEVVVVDDGSPVKAEHEIRGLQFGEPFRLKTICVANGGVGAARNRGLAEVAGSTTLIAFLDSDDTWPANHLERAILAINGGFDFYFSDNRRAGHHESYLRSPYLPKTAAFLDAADQKTGLLELPVDFMVGLALAEFPCQASTVVYRRSIYECLCFNTDLRCSGEDVLFFTTLLTSAGRVCLDLDSIVECGGGVNIYFGHLSWHSERYLSIIVDHLVMRRLLAGKVALSTSNEQMNTVLLNKCRDDLAFHTLRNLVKNPRRAMREMKRLARIAPSAALLLPVDMFRVAVGRLMWHDKRDHVQ